VLDSARHLADLARFAVQRRSQETADREVLHELEQRPLDLPAGLEIEWLGVAGFRLTFEAHTLIVDPYLSRITLRSFLRGGAALPDRAVVGRLLVDPGTVVGVVAGHTHFDHALDVPAVAERFGCSAYGSRSLARLMALHGLAPQAVEVEPFGRYELGPFDVTFVPSRHSKIVLGRRVPMDGEIAAREVRTLSARAYRCGQVWAFVIEVAGLRLYHQGSADLIDDAVPDSGADVFLAGVAGREFTRDYWRRILLRLRPDVVVACHHDDFFRRLDEPFAFAPNVRLARVPEEVARVAGGIDVVALPRLVPS
jgi:L-ascorbate metabolism protein UlaG (beta-lactamase superfamily)